MRPTAIPGSRVNPASTVPEQDPPGPIDLLPAEIIHHIGTKISDSVTLGAFARINTRISRVILDASEPVLIPNRFLGNELVATRAIKNGLERLEKTFSIALRYRDKLNFQQWQEHVHLVEKKDCGYGILPTLVLLAPDVLPHDCPMRYEINELLDSFDLNYYWKNSNIPTFHEAESKQDWQRRLFILAVQGGLKKITDNPTPDLYSYAFAASLMGVIPHLPPVLRRDSLLAAAQLPSTLFYDVCLAFLETISVVLDDLLTLPLDHKDVKIFLETLELGRYYSKRHRTDFVYLLTQNFDRVLAKLPAAHWSNNQELALDFVLEHCAWAAAGSNAFRIKGPELLQIKKHCIKTGFFTEKEWSKLEAELRKPGHRYAEWLSQSKQQTTIETSKNKCVVS